ncbi:hypothetical protein [Streptomyces spiramenti]|uniref:ABC transporter n=1 Tax=Streptomyces spiramenti TaxID=2720606 RepID=A0ABX1AHZ6_9ACTN|nr:hypothetical protein [Streptomyces spiramenti]NJP65830.1 hypothetical protein [Streptomyces spiramenti]
MTSTDRSPRRRCAAAAAVALTALLAAGCAGEDTTDPPEETAATEEQPHGYVEGAEETAEQQTRLLLADPSTGEAGVLDLISEEFHPLGAVDGLTGVTGDGRFVHLHTADGAALVDTGAWTTDHGDHVHHYRAAVREFGELPGDGPLAVRADAGVLVTTAEDGGARVLPRRPLEEHDATELPEARQLDGRFAAPVVPFREHLVALDATGGEPVVTVLSREGDETARLDAACEEPRGDAVTRRGVVLGCADGALLVTEAEGGFAVEEIPYPGGTDAADRAESFHHRAGSNAVAALAGPEAVWLLDLTERDWRRVETGPVVAATTAGEEGPLLALSDDGALSSYDTADGSLLATGEPLTSPATGGADAPAPVVEITASRAYVNDAASGTVYEIDHNDGLRVARSFGVGPTPALMAEAGR